MRSRRTVLLAELGEKCRSTDLPAMLLAELGEKCRSTDLPDGHSGTILVSTLPLLSVLGGPISLYNSRHLVLRRSVSPKKRRKMGTSRLQLLVRKFSIFYG